MGYGIGEAHSQGITGVWSAAQAFRLVTTRVKMAGVRSKRTLCVHGSS